MRTHNERRLDGRNARVVRCTTVIMGHGECREFCMHNYNYGRWGMQSIVGRAYNELAIASCAASRPVHIILE